MYKVEINNKEYTVNNLLELIEGGDLITFNDKLNNEMVVHVLNDRYLEVLCRQVPGLSLNIITGIYKKSGKDYIKIAEKVNEEWVVIDHASR